MSSVNFDKPYAVLLEYSSDGVLILDSDAKVIEFNQKALEIFSYTNTEICQLQLLKGKKEDIELKKLCQSDSLIIDHNFISRSGRDMYVKINSKPFEGTWILLIEDITYLRKLERNLTQSGNLLQKRTSEMKCLTRISQYTWDDDTELDHLLFLITNTIPMGFDKPEDLAVLISVREEQYSSDSVVIMENPIRSPIMVNNQEIGSVQVYYRSEQSVKDIGPFYIEEEVLIDNIADRIGKLVERRENWARIKQQEEKLIETEKLKVVSQMVGGIAHDFNNLLTTIMGFTELSQELIDDPKKVSQYLELIMSAAKTGSNLTSKLLSFGKQNKIIETEFTFNELIEDMAPILEGMLPNKIKLNYDLDTTEEIRADINIIERIILNLVLNSKEAFTDGGDIIISCKDILISKHHILQPGKYVKLMIKDTGMGMTEEIQEHIFNPFFTTKEHGTGLGLASVKTTVDELEGHIEISSKLGEGTTVSIFLPVVIDYSYAPKEREQEMLNKFKVEGLNILIVEDEKQVSSVLKAALESKNTIHLFNYPIKALEWVIQQDAELDLIITDILMPKMNGIHLINTLQKHLAKMPPTLFISAYTSDNLEQSIEITPHFLKKPFTITNLMEKLNDVLESQ